MDTEELVQAIASEDVNVDRFVRLAISDAQIRDAIMHQMVTHPHIMVYYHCYYVADKASQERPDLFYPYWFTVAPLLQHANSYHRDIALTIIANLTQVDHSDLFPELYDDYFEHINDVKFMTGQCCVQNSVKVLRNKPALRSQITTLLLDLDNWCTYPEKQKALLKCDVLEVLDGVYGEICAETGVEEFVRAGVTSISPKTRRKAKELVRKYGL
jgi:hypothetical protein